MKKDFILHHFWLKNGAGFTLIEIVLTIFIMSWGIIAIMQVFPTTLMVSKDTEEMTRATFLAERKMEEVKGRIRHENDFANDYNDSPTAFPLPDENYKYTVDDTEVEYPNEVKEIKVTVWHDKNNNDSWEEKEENGIILDTKVAKRS